MKKLLLFFCSLGATAAIQAQIIHVPGDFPTIQQGINHADSGDIVLVAEGIYYEQINFKGKKPLTVASHFLLDGNADHIAKTIIDASQLLNTDSASVVYFISGEDTTSVLCGFTIRNGIGTYVTDALNFRHGGGILISGAGAKIIHNRITHNCLDNTQAVNGAGVGGAGISTPWEDGNHWVVIANNTIDSNTCISNYYSWGGGISISYNSRIIDNLITYNTCSGLGDGIGQSAGIDVGKQPEWPSQIVAIIENNIITHNLSQSDNYWANSAGVMTSYIPIVFAHNEVAYNTVVTGTSAGGAAGLYLYQPDTGCVVRNNVFKGNVSNLWYGGLAMENNVISDNRVLVENNRFYENVAISGAAFGTFGVPVTLQNNVFSRNHADFKGGALYLDGSLGAQVDHLASLINNSFAHNTAHDYGGSVFSVNADPLIFNCIFWQDSATYYDEIYNSGGLAEIAYSDIDTNEIYVNRLLGAGILHEDPLFTDPELLTIEDISPVKNAATEFYTCHCGDLNHCPQYDIAGNNRPINGGYDMGAWEDIMAGIGGKRITNDELRITNYPNPVTGSTLFHYFLNEPSKVVIQIFDSFGKLIGDPVNSFQQKGEKNIQWNSGDLPAGIYFFRIQAGYRVGSGKIIKL